MRTSAKRPARYEEHSRYKPLVVFIEASAVMGGVEFSTLYLAERMDRARWRPLVICPQEGDLPDACHKAGVPVHVLRRPALRSTSIRISGDRRVPNPFACIWDLGVIGLAAQQLAGFLSMLRPNIIVTKGLFPHFYGGLAARQLGLPCIWHIQDYISERWGGLYRRAFGRAACWLPTQIVVDGAPIARQLPRSLQQRVRVIYNGVDTAIFRPGQLNHSVRSQLGLPIDSVVIGNVARITPWKGQHYLIQAFAKLASKYPSAYLLLVGAPVFDNDAYEQRLRELTDQLDLADRVVFAGYRRDLPQVLAAMDIFAYTSLEKDTSPLALLSALASGLPTVAFDIEGVREVLGSPPAGRLTPTHDHRALAQELDCLLQSDYTRQQLGHAARQRAQTTFSLDHYVNKMEEELRIAVHPLRRAYDHSTHL